MTNNLDKYKYICDNDNKMYYKYNNIIFSIFTHSDEHEYIYVNLIDIKDKCNSKFLTLEYCHEIYNELNELILYKKKYIKSNKKYNMCINGPYYHYKIALVLLDHIYVNNNNYYFVELKNTITQFIKIANGKNQDNNNNNNNNDLITELDKLKKDYDKVKSDNNDLITELDNVKKDYDKVNTELDKVKSENDNIIIVHDKMITEIYDLQAENYGLKSKLINQKTRCRRYRRKLNKKNKK